jgi:hypothetical protein
MGGALALGWVAAGWRARGSAGRGGGWVAALCWEDRVGSERSAIWIQAHWDESLVGPTCKSRPGQRKRRGRDNGNADGCSGKEAKLGTGNNYR